MILLLVLSRHFRALVASILLGGASSLPAVQVYVDATGGAAGNTYNNATNSLTDWWVADNTLTVDGKWGYRNSSTSSSVAYEADTYELSSNETSLTLRTEIQGLQPGATYSGVRVYFIGRAANTNNNNWPLDVSPDGVNWTTLIDFGAPGYSGTLVDAGNNGIGIPLASTTNSIKRIWYALPDALADNSGILRFYIRKGTGASGRSVYDGIGYDNAPLNTTTDPYSDSVHISEFMADNPGPIVLPGSVSDMDGDSSDWIELHNSGTVAADLSGWFLTDDPLLAQKWSFPAGTVLNPDARLLVFASGKNRQVNGVQLHTNFKLSKSGFLQLSRPAPTGPDVVLSTFGTPTTGYLSHNGRSSYGSSSVPPTALSYGFFTAPTPLAANAATVVLDFVKSADTDVDRGVFTSPFTVALTCPTAGSTILYTLDGSVPVPGASGTTAILPTDELTPPTGTLNVNVTTILRTRAVKTGHGPSKVDCHTYLFPAQVLNQAAPPAHFPAAANWSHYGSADWAMDPNIVNHANPESQCTVEDLLSIPSVSLIMDWSELFGTSGIYPAIAPVPEEGLNKAANIELLNPDGSKTSPNSGEHFSAPGHTHIFGGTSQDRWKVDKLSFNFNVNGSVSTGVYGDTATGTYGRFILDARMGNTWLHATDNTQRTRGDYIRDEVAAEVQRRQGYAGTHSRRIHLYLNGMYWGLYTLHEKPDADFQAAYQGGDPDDWDILKHSPLRDDCIGGGTFVNPAISAEVKTNNTSYVNYQAMLATVANGVDLTNNANYDTVGTKLDLDAFIDYILLNFYLGNFDWAHQNWYASYRRNHPSARWRFHSWDAENVLRESFDENVITGGATITNANQASCPTFIHQRLSTNTEYRMRFADRMHKWFFNDGLFTTPKLAEVCNRQFAEIDAAMRCESARWGDNRAPARPSPLTNVPYTRGAEWLAEKSRMLDVIVPARNPLILNSLKSKTNALYPRVDPASTASAIFHAPSYAQHGGRVPSGYELTITNPNGTLGTVYYTLDGSDPRMTGGELRPSALTYTGPVPLSGSMNVRSRVKDGNVWSAINEAAFSVGTVAPDSSNLTISKIMWKPAPPTEADILAGFTDDSEFEYLELYNPSANPVDLTGIGFSAGLDIAPMSEDPVDIAPGSRVVLAAKPSAFLHRYGSSPRVVGKFVNDSNLSGSERITLVDASGTNIITSFIYNAVATGPWPKNETSGTGAALVLIQPELKPDPSLGVNWRASLPINPAPGSDDRPDLTKWQLQHFGGATDLAADTDADGLANLIEFALGLDPNSGDDPSRRPAFSFTNDPVPAIVFSFRRQKFLENLSWEVEHATTLDTWSTVPGPVETLSIVDHGDGTETITYRSPLDEGNPARFFRLRLISQ
jgi:hypothetical protein